MSAYRPVPRVRGRGVTSIALSVKRTTASPSSIRISSFVTRNVTRFRPVSATLFVDMLVRVLECSSVGSLAANGAGR